MTMKRSSGEKSTTLMVPIKSLKRVGAPFKGKSSAREEKGVNR